MKPTIKKLILKAETVRTLTAAQARRAVGGAVASADNSCADEMCTTGGTGGGTGTDTRNTGCGFTNNPDCISTLPSCIC
jgi:hypothetical protein